LIRHVNLAYLVPARRRHPQGAIESRSRPMSTAIGMADNLHRRRIELSFVGMNSLGRFLQLFALSVLPLAMVLELTDALGRSFGLSEMLIMLVFGVIAFWLGRLLEGYSPNKG
jgi:hypothetical protein